MEGDCAVQGLPVASHPISIHSLRVEGDATRAREPTDDAISIHSLRVEGDPTRSAEERQTAISIHSLRVEGDRAAKITGGHLMAFQSTPSVWRETQTKQWEEET